MGRDLARRYSFTGQAALPFSGRTYPPWAAHEKRDECDRPRATLPPIRHQYQSLTHPRRLRNQIPLPRKSPLPTFHALPPPVSTPPKSRPTPPPALPPAPHRLTPSPRPRPPPCRHPP